MEFLKDKFKDKTAVARVVVGTIAGFCVTAVVHQVIENNTEPETSLDNARIRAGSVLIGLMAADKASAWTGAIINNTVDQWNEAEDYLPEEVATEET